MSKRSSIFSNTWMFAIEHKARKHKYPEKYRECRIRVHDFSTWSNDVFSNYLRPYSNWQWIIFLHLAANSNLNLPPLLKSKLKLKFGWQFEIEIEICLPISNTKGKLIASYGYNYWYQGCIKYELTARDKMWGSCMDEESYGPRPGISNLLFLSNGYLMTVLIFSCPSLYVWYKFMAAKFVYNFIWKKIKTSIHNNKYVKCNFYYQRTIFFTIAVKIYLIHN